MRLILATPPADPAPDLLERVKVHLKVDGDEEDVDILAHIQTAFTHLDGEDGWLNRALLRQTWDMFLDGFPPEIVLPYPPLHEIVSVVCLDDSLVEQTLAADVDYRLIPGGRRHARLIPGRDVSWPSTYREPGAVRIRFTAGYEKLPPPIVSAIKLIVGDLYAFHETAMTGTIVAEVPMSSTVENLLANYRVGGIA